MIEEHLRQDGCEVYYLDGLWSRVVVATFDTPERAAAWLAVWQEHAALEAERDALEAKVARVEAVLSRWEQYPSDWAFAGYARRIRAALAGPAPTAAADDAALDELRQSWWPRLDAVLGNEDEDGE